MKKKTMNILIIIAAIIFVLAIWFNIPFSPVKKQFQKDVKVRFDKITSSTNDVFTNEDFATLPPVIQKYLSNCGYIGTEKKSVLSMEYRNVSFATGRNGAKLKIDYSQKDFADAPDRLSFIDSKMFGVPFQGYDYYLNGTGGMKGVLAKAFTLFDQTGDDMNQACLVTYLSESLFLPQALLSGFITFSQIDEHTVAAEIEYYGIKATGLFHFNENFEMTSFTTDNRGQTSADGKMEYIPWSAECEDYVLYSDGIKRPTVFRAVWNYPDERFVYFDGKIDSVNGVRVK